MIAGCAMGSTCMPGKITQREVAHDLGYDYHDPESLLS